MIHKMIKDMVSNSYKDGELVNRKLLMIATIIKLHTEFPWRNDLADVIYETEQNYQQQVKDGTDKNHNWLIKKGKDYIFILNLFKTKRKYIKIIAPVEDVAVRKQLKIWLVMGEVELGSHLFTWDDKKPITRNNISVLLTNETKKYVGLPISTTLLVKIFNDMPTNYKDLTQEDIAKHKKLAMLRGHDVLTRFTIYKK